MSDPQQPKPTSAVELKAQIELEREGRPFLVYRDGEGEQVLRAIGADEDELWIGRSPSTAISLEWDEEASSLHAELEIIGDHCTLIDDGLSTNGSYVNGERVQGRKLLRDRDVIKVGRTTIIFRSPVEAEAASTVVSTDALTAAGVSPAQKRVLTALCRPYKDGPSFATPATNQQIADELHLSVDAVKTHLRALFEKFGLESEAQNVKRVALVERAMHSGLIRDRDL